MIFFSHKGTVGVFDGWSSYGTLTLERGRADRECEESAVDNRRPLLFDEGEAFTLRVGPRFGSLVKKLLSCRSEKTPLLSSLANSLSDFLKFTLHKLILLFLN